MDATMESTGQLQREALTSARFPMLLFIDGECAFCNRWAYRVKDADHASRIRFGAKQGKTFEQLAQLHPELARADSVVLVSRRADGTEEFLLRSAAIRQVIAGLPGFRFFELILQLCPTPISDLGYRIFSKLRAPLFGKWHDCRSPLEKDRELYVD